MDPLDKEFLDQWLNEVDQHCRATWGTVAERGRDQRVIRKGQATGGGNEGTNGAAGHNGGGGNDNRHDFKLFPAAAQKLRDTFFPNSRSQGNYNNFNNKGGRQPAFRNNNARPGIFRFNTRPLRPI